MLTIKAYISEKTDSSLYLQRLFQGAGDLEREKFKERRWTDLVNNNNNIKGDRRGLEAKILDHVWTELS